MHESNTHSVGSWFQSLVGKPCYVMSNICDDESTVQRALCLWRALTFNSTLSKYCTMIYYTRVLLAIYYTCVVNMHKHSLRGVFWDILIIYYTRVVNGLPFTTRV